MDRWLDSHTYSNMTPKEKAKELVDKCYQLFPLQKDVIANVGDLSWEYDNWKQAKQCALIAVDELIEETEDEDTWPQWKWWKEVKQEIEKL